VAGAVSDGQRQVRVGFENRSQPPGTGENPRRNIFEYIVIGVPKPTRWAIAWG